MLGLKSKLKNCKHINTNAYEYVRQDTALDDAIVETDPKRIDALKMHLTGIRFCLDCGATQRFKLWDPLAISEGNQPEPWMAPWFWRNS